MMSTNSIPRIPSRDGEPAWEVATILPGQGECTEDDFFSLHTNQMAELVDGRLEILPTPTWLQQVLVVFFLESIKNFIVSAKIGGVVLVAPLPAHLFKRTIREPDVLYVAEENIPDPSISYPTKLDLVVEVVSEGAEARRRDYEHKRIDYARAGIKEYWIVDPEDQCITVLVLNGLEYDVLRVFRIGDTATGRIFKGFEIDVSHVFSLAKSPRLT